MKTTLQVQVTQVCFRIKNGDLFAILPEKEFEKGGTYKLGYAYDENGKVQEVGIDIDLAMGDSKPATDYESLRKQLEKKLGNLEVVKAQKGLGK